MISQKLKSSPQIDLTMPETGWMDTPTMFKKGIYCHAARAKDIESLNMPNPRDWRVEDDDWKLPENWQDIILEGLRERLEKFRSLRIFMDTCVRCGACADKCHFFIGSGDPKKYAGAQGRTPSIGVPQQFHKGRKDHGQNGRGLAASPKKY